MVNDTAFVRNPNYDTMRDDISTLSFDHMQEVVTSPRLGLQASTGTTVE